MALCLSWLPVTICIIPFSSRALFRSDSLRLGGRLFSGMALIAFEVWLFARLSRDLGAARLIGRTEISGSGSLAEEGIYARMRHPRYVGSFLALAGACLLAGTRVTWIVSLVWAVLTWIAISLEERELRTRFGEAYERYCRRVPRFLPRLRIQSEPPEIVCVTPSDRALKPKRLTAGNSSDDEERFLARRDRPRQRSVGRFVG